MMEAVRFFTLLADFCAATLFHSQHFQKEKQGTFIRTQKKSKQESEQKIANPDI